jgi:cleavage and polyadenylation specificity factor subunit 1
VTDASTTAMGAVLQQVQDTWQPLAFFCRMLSPTQQKYSPYDRELLSIYEAVWYFRHMFEARHFTIITDHKQLMYAFQQNRDKFSSLQFNQLEFVSQFTTDIRHIPGKDNIVADTLSRVEVITAPITYDAVASAHNKDDELQTLLGSATGLQLTKLFIPGTSVEL